MTIYNSSLVHSTVVFTSDIADLTVPAGEDLVIKMGDAAGVNKVSFVDSAGVEQVSINSDGDLDVNGNFTFGDVSTDVLTINGQLHIGDDLIESFGNTSAAPNVNILWETADANANEFIISLPEGGATDVPVLVLGDTTLLNKDLGLFNGVTAPTFAVVDGSATKALYFRHDGTNGGITSTSGGIVYTVSSASFAHSFSGGAVSWNSNGIFSSATSSYIGLGGVAATDTFITYDETTAQMGIFLGSASGRQFIIGEATYNVYSAANDYDHATQTNPTLYLQSVNSPEVDNRQWVKWYNDGSNSYHLTGIGGHRFGFEAIQANAIITFTSNPTTNDGVVFTVNTGTLTGKTAGAGANEFNFGASLSATLTNLVTAWNLIAGTGVVAHKNGNTVVFEASATGSGANAYVTTETTDTDNVYNFQSTLRFTAVPTTNLGVVLTVGTGTLTGTTGVPGANQFQIASTLTETLDNLVRAYNALATGVNAIRIGDDVYFDGGTSGVSIFTETTDTDNVYSFVTTTMTGGREFSAFMDMQPTYLKLTKQGTASAGTTTYSSQYFGLMASAWDTDDLVPRDVEVRLQTTATSSTSGTGTLNISHWRGGVVTATMATINSGGTATFAGNVNSTNATFATTASLPITVKGNDADDANGVGVALDAGIALTTAGSKLVSIKNATAEKAYVDYLGSFNAGAGTALLPAYSFVGDPNTGLWNLAADSIGFVTGGTTRATLTDSSLALTGTLTGITTAITGTINTALTLSVPNQGANTNNGVGIVIQADDGGTGTTGGVGGSITLRAGDSKGTDPHVGGDIVLDTGLNVGAARRGFVDLKFNNTDFGWVIPAGSSGATLGLAGTDADGANAIGVILGAYNDLTNATSKIASFRDNISSAGGTEKLAVDLDGKITAANSIWKREFHLGAESANPGASGATPTELNGIFSYLLNATTEYLYFATDIHSDWDTTSDIIIEVGGYLPNAETANDLVRMSVRCDYGTAGELANAFKTQTISQDYDIVNGNAQYTYHKITFTIDHDLVDNVIEVGDFFSFRVWLDDVTTAPVVPAFNLTYVNMYYLSKKPELEA